MTRSSGPMVLDVFKSESSLVAMQKNIKTGSIRKLQVATLFATGKTQTVMLIIPTKMIKQSQRRPPERDTPLQTSTREQRSSTCGAAALVRRLSPFDQKRKRFPHCGCCRRRFSATSIGRCAFPPIFCSPPFLANLISKRPFYLPDARQSSTRRLSASIVVLTLSSSLNFAFIRLAYMFIPRVLFRAFLHQFFF